MNECNPQSEIIQTVLRENDILKARMKLEESLEKLRVANEEFAESLKKLNEAVF